MKTKVFHIPASFKSIVDGEDVIIEGMASTDSTDRVGDVILTSAWEKGGLANYKKNPIILFNHNYDKPIGRAMELGTNDKGLQLKAKIAKSAGEVRDLIKEGVLGAFSVGFMLKDAEYMPETNGFKITEAELLEVSVVSVPANQDATFSVAKSFDSTEEYKEFLKTFGEGSSSDEPESTKVIPPKTQETTMDEDTKKAVADAVKEALAQMQKAQAERDAAEKAEKAAADKARAEKEAQDALIATAVKTGAEKLMADFEKAMAEKDAKHQEILDQFKADLEKNSEELNKMRENKMQFADRKNGKGLEAFREEILDAHVLGVITGKGYDTKLGKQLIEKVNTNTGVTVPTATGTLFETFVSTQLEADMELELMLDPLFRKVQVNAASTVVPLVPDAGYAEFVAGAGGGSGAIYNGNLAQRGDTAGSPFGGVSLDSVTLVASKLVSRSYIANETEEDAIIPVLPVIRGAMARSHARAIEQSILLGGHSTAALTGAYDGLVEMARDASKTLNVASPYSATLPTTIASSLLDMRQAMGKYGRRPGDVVYIVSLECYYALLDDTDFQIANELGSVGTRVTGQLGAVYGSPVMVCDEFPAVADGNAFAVAVNTRNFVVPVLRGMTVEQEYSATNQYLCLISTQRRGFHNLFSAGAGGQVVALTY